MSPELRARSVWSSTVPEGTRAPLTTHAQTDVCIVGAGIAGMSTAYQLSRMGKSVVVIDDGPIGGGMTAMTSAHLSNAIDDRYIEIERLHGADGAQLAASSHTAAIDEIERAVIDEQIACDFARLDGYLFLGADQEEELLDREAAAAQRAGLVDVRKLSRAPGETFDTGPCLRFPRQAQFHPLRYLVGLATAIERQGGRIFTGTRADRIEGGAAARVHVGPHVIQAGYIVVATNTPVNDIVTVHTKQAPYMSYVVSAFLSSASVEKALYWDTEDPYHYIRFHAPNPKRPESTLVIVGGEDHKTGQVSDTEECYARLEGWARERFPSMGPLEFRWAGQVMEPIDGLAFIGRNPGDAENVLIVTGDSGMGLTHGTIAGLLLTDLIAGKANPWTQLYDPSRTTLRAATEFAKESLNVAVQYTDWLTPGDVSSVDEIQKDCGAVLRCGLKKVAVYRDEGGALHAWSAVCPHLGCIVRWNPTEKTWDCPCHGSRFDNRGDVVSGPAPKGLEQTPLK